MINLRYLTFTITLLLFFLQRIYRLHEALRWLLHEGNIIPLMSINNMIDWFTDFQCTSDIQNNTDNLHEDDDALRPADLMTFAWQIAKGMVRVLYVKRGLW